MNVSQLDFSGGMSSLTDATKPPEACYRLGINVRVRKNALIPAFRHRQLNTPDALHQAVFANDNQLGLIAAGGIFRVNLEDDLCVPIGGSAVISSTVDRVWHKAVPAPTNYLVDNQYQPTVSTAVECIVIQDGTSQPTLIFPDFASRPAGTFAEWTFENPEYIPIGTFMAYSGRKLFIANGAKIYQSVSGRPTDFVLNIDNNGNKQGNADTTAMAVSSPPLTAIVPSQTSGILAFTRYQTYSLEPEYSLPLIFGEPQYIPSDVFPVGAVNDLAFAFVNGESLFISPSGIQAFNQVFQVQRSSNNTPYGAKIIDYINRPITSTAAAVVDDYTFIALSTVYGPAILVHDNVLNTFVGFDLTLGDVKEFATIEDEGLTRLFYITATGLFEIPLLEGTRSTGMVYFGEFSTGQANKKSRITDVHLGFNNILSAGEIGMELYVDKVLLPALRQGKTLDYTAEGNQTLLAVEPQRLPIGLDMQSAPLSFDVSEAGYGYSSGVFVSIGADARLVSLALNLETSETTSSTPQIDLNPMDELYFYGEIQPDETLTGETQYDVVIGQKYVLFGPIGNVSVLNGNETVSTRENTATVFTARAEIVFTTADAVIYDYETFLGTLIPKQDTILITRLGGLDNPYPLQAITRNAGLLPRAVLGSYELATATRGRAFYDAFDSYSQMRLEYENCNVFCFSDIPANLAIGGPAMSWLAGQIQAYGVNRFNICVFPRSPYTEGGTNATDLRWPFEELGVQLVISGNDAVGYERTFVNGIHYIVNASASNSNQPGNVHLTVMQNVIQGTFGRGLDQFTIPR